MFSIGDILQLKQEAYKANPLLASKLEKTKYNKDWNNGVACFQKAINTERKKDKLPPLEFIAIRQKLLALKEIDDLRWFFYHCRKYAKTKDKQGRQNTFCKCFFGALKLK